MSGQRILLREDHRKIRELSAQYRLAVEQRSEARQSLAEEICMQLELHAQVEEDLLYPAVRSQDEAFVNESIEEHRGVERDIGQIELLTPKDPRYDHIMMRMIEAVERHLEQRGKRVVSADGTASAAHPSRASQTNHPPQRASSGIGRRDGRSELTLIEDRPCQA